MITLLDKSALCARVCQALSWRELAGGVATRSTADFSQIKRIARPVEKPEPFICDTHPAMEAPTNSLSEGLTIYRHYPEF